MTANTNSLSQIMVDYEAAYEAVSELENKEVLDLEGVTIYSGKHPKHGFIHITIPAIGDCVLLLPFALQQF